MLANKLAGGRYAGCLVGQTQRCLVCHDVKASLLGHIHGRRSKHRSLHPLGLHGRQTVRQSADLEYGDIFDRGETDPLEGITDDKIRGRAEAADRYGSSLELLRGFYLRTYQEPIFQYVYAAVDH